MKFVSKILIYTLICTACLIKASDYNGVTWNKKQKKWNIGVYINGSKRVSGQAFTNELAAAKEVDILCDKFGLKRKNFEKDGTAIPKRVIVKTSIYKNVYYDTKRAGKCPWVAWVKIKGKIKKKYCQSELQAAYYVDFMCDMFNLPRKNFDKDGNEIYTPKMITQTQLELNSFETEKNIKPTTCKRKREELKIDNFNEYESYSKCDGTYKYDPIEKFKEDGTIVHTQTVTKYNRDDDSIFVIADYLLKLFDLAVSAQKYEIENVHMLKKNSQAAITLAAQRGYCRFVKLLIVKGMDKMEFTNDGHTALSLAVCENHSEVVKVLFEEWMNPNYINEENKMHLSPIYNVKSWEMVQFLVDQDTITHNIFNENHQTPLTIASQNGLLDVVKFFVLNDDLDLNHIDNFNKTPLDYAYENNHQNVVKFLKQNGAIFVNYCTYEDHFKRKIFSDYLSLLS